MIRYTLAVLVTAALANTSAMAAAPGGVSLSLDHHIVIAAPHGAPGVKAYLAKKPKSSTIFSNIATLYPDGLYFSGEGDTLCGPNCGLGESIAVAGGFTPSATAKAVEVDAAVGYIEGTNEITLAIYSDSSGAPGTALWSGVAKPLPGFGVCCGLAVGKIKGGLSLTAGTPYWVVAITDSKETTTFAAWNLATTEQISGSPAAYNDNNTSWTSYSTILPPAFAVYSK